MEVHAHTHTARKKWTHYFWEFLMLFLAVFCGFWQNTNWNIKLKKTGKSNICEVFYEDLQQDSVNMSVG